MKNVGSIDKVFRIIVAAVLFSLYFVLEGNARYFALVGIIPLVTAFIGFCPLDPLFGINTCAKKGS